MSRKYTLQKSTDYGHSWISIEDNIESEEIALERLSEMREPLVKKRSGKERYRLDVVEPVREAPSFDYLDSWLSGYIEGVKELEKWLTLNYKGRTVSMPSSKTSVFVHSVTVQATTKATLTVYLWGKNNQLIVDQEELKALILE